MRKLLSILIAAVFALSTGSVFAAAHMKAAGEKTDATPEKVKTDEMKAAEAKKAEMKTTAKKDKKAKKAVKKEARKAESATKGATQVDDMKKDAEKK
jgi:hypothetical protein